MTARHCIWCSDELSAEDHTTSIATGLEFCGANSYGINHEPERCRSCDGYGWVDIHHASTDAVIGSRPCSLLGDPQWHTLPPPPRVSLVKPHHCNGLCCPPF